MFEIMPVVMIILLLAIIASFRRNTKGISFIIYNLPFVIGISSAISVILTAIILIFFNFTDSLPILTYSLSVIVIWGILNGGIIIFIYGFTYSGLESKVIKYKDEGKLIEKYEDMVVNSNKLIDTISVNYPAFTTTNEILKRSIIGLEDLLEFAKNKQINSKKLDTWAEVSILKFIVLYNHSLNKFYDKLIKPGSTDMNKLGKYVYDIINIGERAKILIEFIKMSDIKKH